MKKTPFKLIAVAMLCSSLLTSCYTYTTVVGDGAKGDKQVQKWNHYLIGGLAPLKVSDPKELAGGAKNYTVTVKQTFINGLVAGITFGIYTPTTTFIKQ